MISFFLKEKTIAITLETFSTMESTATYESPDLHAFLTARGGSLTTRDTYQEYACNTATIDSS